MNFFDTAGAYGDGRSERLIGEAMAGARERVVIATKAGIERFGDAPDFAPDRIRRALEASLRPAQDRSCRSVATARSAARPVSNLAGNLCGAGGTAARRAHPHLRRLGEIAGGRARTAATPRHSGDPGQSQHARRARGRDRASRHGRGERDRGHRAHAALLRLPWPMRPTIASSRRATIAGAGRRSSSNGGATARAGRTRPPHRRARPEARRHCDSASPFRRFRRSFPAS